MSGMAEQLVGHVEALWRYPVKSMLGEQPPQVDVTAGGICGDRAYALWDHATQRVASAKNPLVWKALLHFRAQFLSPPQPGEPMPPVAIAGRETAAPLHSGDSGIDAALTGLMGRQVSLLNQAPAGASLDQYWPDVKERQFQNVVNELPLPEGTFFDACPIHALTTATLEELRRREPQLDFAVERFRPNLLIRPSGPAEGFVEEAWSGHTLRLGREVLLRVDGGCPRCVVTTLAQGDLPQEIEILRATARHNQVVAGMRLSVLQPGSVALGDPVLLC
ncbi:putative Fe-S protein [Cyanobium sp. NIES-981]|nr:putative Fe-S protein [Cyanobium sp. NIES-981]